MTDLESVRTLVYDTLAARFDARVVNPSGTERFMVTRGSTGLVVTVFQRGDGHPIVVSIDSAVLSGVPASAELFEYVALNADSYYMGHLNVTRSDDSTCDVWFTHKFLGEHFDAESFTAACRMVLGTADELDDELRTRFGGDRWIDD